LLDVRDLTKEYRGGVRANDGICLTVAAGEVFGLFGHNGAGKTTAGPGYAGAVARGDRVRLELVAVDEAGARRLAGDFAAGWHAAPVVSGRRVVAQIAPSATAAALGWAQGWRDSGQVDEFSVTPTSLEDVYLALVGGNGIEGAESDASLVA